MNKPKVPYQFQSDPGFFRFPQCVHCKHALPYNKCDAFPDGIPDEINKFNRHDHRKPFPGDNGIRFESDSGGVDEDWFRPIRWPSRVREYWEKGVKFEGARTD